MLSYTGNNNKNMETHDTLVYVGAGLDMIPVMLFRNFKTYIYVDSQPLTEFGSLEPTLSRPEFNKDLSIKMLNLGFRRCTNESNENLDIWINIKTGNELHYYKNQCFPNKIDDTCVKAISNASVLVCCGFIPNQRILEMMKTGPKLFIGDNKTAYKYDEGDDSGLVQVLETQPGLFEKYFRYDIPKMYRYWERDYVEKHHVCNFKVTQYTSLKDLYNTKLLL